MPNIHTPQRLAGESWTKYQERRVSSRFAVLRMTCAGMHGGTSSRQQLRDAMRRNGTMGLRTRAADVLMDHFAQKRKEAIHEGRRVHPLI